MAAGSGDGEARGFGAFAAASSGSQPMSAFAALAADAIKGADTSTIAASSDKGFVPLDASMYAGTSTFGMAVGFEAPKPAPSESTDQADAPEAFSSFGSFGQASTFGSSTAAQPEAEQTSSKRSREEDDDTQEVPSSVAAIAEAALQQPPVALSGAAEATGEESETTLCEVRARMYAWADSSTSKPSTAKFGVASSATGRAATPTDAALHAAGDGAGDEDSAAGPDSKRQRQPDPQEAEASDAAETSAVAEAGEAAETSAVAEASEAAETSAVAASAPSGEWVEMGTGPLRVNQVAGSDKRRLVMRQEGEAGGTGMRVLVNAWVEGSLQWKASKDSVSGGCFAHAQLPVSGRSEAISLCLLRFRSQADLDAATTAVDNSKQ